MPAAFAKYPCRHLPPVRGNSLAGAGFATGLAARALAFLRLLGSFLIGSMVRPGRGRASLFAVALSVLAVVNVVSLSSWHDAMDDHGNTSVESVLGQQDTDNISATLKIELHGVAHSVIHGFANMVLSAGVLTGVTTVATVGFIVKNHILSGINPESLLRPPRR